MLTVAQSHPAAVGRVQRNRIEPIIDDPLCVETPPVTPGVHTQR